MGSIADSSEKPMIMCFSNKKGTRPRPRVTLFEDLLHHSNARLDLNSDADSCPSDCESGITGSATEQCPPTPYSGLIRIPEGETVYDTIARKLVCGLSSCGLDNARIEAVRRRDYSGIMERAKLQTFFTYSRAVEMRRSGDANVKYAWFGCLKTDITRILSHGFGFTEISSTQGHGVCLSPVDYPVESLRSAAADEDGVRHMLMCRVILGKMEGICPGSDRSNPSSEEFDSGVDDLASPRKYIVWSSQMNTHILPYFVVSFRASSQRKPNSHWMPFATLIAALSRFLPARAVDLITKHYQDYKKKRVTRYEMIQRVRRIAGDELLMSIIKTYRRK